jgi:hypothetical protein
MSRCCGTLLSVGLSRNHSHISGDTKPVGSFRARPTLGYGKCHHTNPTPRINIRSTPAELTEQIPAPAETRSSSAQESTSGPVCFGSRGTTDQDRSVSTPTNNTKPRSNCRPSGDSLAGSRPSLELADAAVDGGQGGGLVTLTQAGLNRFALPAHRGMRQPVLDQHPKSARSRLSLPRATGRVGTPVPAPLVCARRGPGPPGTCPRNSREREGAVVVGWCGNGDLLGESRRRPACARRGPSVSGKGWICRTSQG